jgi:hypothetical protein
MNRTTNAVKIKLPDNCHTYYIKTVKPILCATSLFLKKSGISEKTQWNKNQSTVGIFFPLTLPFRTCFAELELHFVVLNRLSVYCLHHAQQD